MAESSTARDGAAGDASAEDENGLMNAVGSFIRSFTPQASPQNSPFTTQRGTADEPEQPNLATYRGGDREEARFTEV